MTLARFPDLYTDIDDTRGKAFALAINGLSAIRNCGRVVRDDHAIPDEQAAGVFCASLRVNQTCVLKTDSSCRGSLLDVAGQAVNCIAVRNSSECEATGAPIRISYLTLRLDHGRGGIKR